MTNESYACFGRRFFAGAAFAAILLCSGSSLAFPTMMPARSGYGTANATCLNAGFAGRVQKTSNTGSCAGTVAWMMPVPALRTGDPATNPPFRLDLTVHANWPINLSTYNTNLSESLAVYAMNEASDSLAWSYMVCRDGPASTITRCLGDYYVPQYQVDSGEDSVFILANLVTTSYWVNSFWFEWV
jgi:hypothetical protein